MAKKKSQRARGDSGPEAGVSISTSDSAAVSDKKQPSFIVAIGASAGGLEALGRFFAAMPLGSGLSFVVIQHLSPDHPSFMVDLLSKRTTLSVRQAEEGLAVAPEWVYLLPPGKDLKIFKGRLQLFERSIERGIHMPIDIFFRSLAEDQQQRAIGMVFSGTGSDGTSGIRAIKDAGGVVFVQSEASSQFDGMPRSAITTGLADFIGTPEDLPGLLLRYVQHPLARSEQPLTQQIGSDDSLAQRIFAALREQNGVDFSYYKPATIDRRIQRRMTVNQLNTLDEYARYLESSPRECQLLFNELLISVTRFFRDPEAWDNLAKEALPALLEKSNPQEPFRVWVPGCASGEEAYTLGIVLTELCERMGINREIKIFATDVSKTQVELAANGLYSGSLVADLSPERLSRYFVQTSDGYQVKTAIRHMIVFARHNLINDPPFTRLDLISCRNLLIYFQPILQMKALTAFHFALKPEGILFLGTSETIGELVDRFMAMGVRSRIYRRRPGIRTADSVLAANLPRGPLSPLRDPIGIRTPRISEYRSSLDAITRDIIHDNVPACIVVNENHDILHTFGKAGDYLRHPEGPPTSNLLKLTAHSFASALLSGLRKAAQKNKEFVYENVTFRRGRQQARVRLRIKPVSAPSSNPVFIVYIDEPDKRLKKASSTKDYVLDRTAARQIRDLEQELAHAKESVQATVEELEASNEELQASNEELLASNEELQSTNEELQSLNEELHTVNSENQARIRELLELTDDVNNLLTCSQIGTVLIDEQLRIRRMSAAVFALTKLTTDDLGAPLEILNRILGPAVLDVAQRAQSQLKTTEAEVHTPEGRSLLVRAAPFRSEASPTRGVTITLIDITELLDTEAKLSATLKELDNSRTFLQATIDAVPSSIAVVNSDGIITHVNKSWESFAEETYCKATGMGSVGSSYFEVCQMCGEGSHVLNGLRNRLTGPDGPSSFDYPCSASNQDRRFRVHAAPLRGKDRGLVICHVEIGGAKTEGAPKSG